MTTLRGIFVLPVACVLAAGLARADLTAARAEPNLEKRADKALGNAEKMLRKADKLNDAGEWRQVTAALEEVRESVELAFTSLKQTGRDPRRSPRHFKRAEIRTRRLLRDLEDLRLRLGKEERQEIEPVRKYIQDVHDDLLEGIMGTGEWKAKR